MFKKLERKDENRGFTLIEILVVIGIIAILAAIVLVAINPALRFAQAQNSQRNGNVTAILDAVGQYMVDNQGDVAGITFPGDTTGADAGELAEITEEFCDSIVPDYLAVMPTDPDSLTGGGAVPLDGDGNCDDITTGNVGDVGDGDVEYTVGYNAETGRLAVCAPNAAAETAIEDAEEICVYR